MTNGNTDVQEGRISVTKIDRLLDGIFISEKIGADKPSAKFFDAVFEKIGGSRDNCVIVGDSLSSDIQGGINAGIRTVYFNPKGKENETGITPDYEIYELSQITALLEEM